MRKLILFGIAMILLINFSYGQTLIYDLRGKVVDHDTNLAISNAKITLSQENIQTFNSYYTRNDGSFEILGFTDIQATGSVDIKIEIPNYYEEKFGYVLPLNPGIIDLGTIYLTPLTSQKKPSDSFLPPSNYVYLASLMEDKKFDYIQIREQYIHKDFISEVASRGDLFEDRNGIDYYRFRPLPGLGSVSIFVKPFSKIEFWKDGRKKEEIELIERPGRETTKIGCATYIYRDIETYLKTQVENAVNIQVCPLIGAPAQVVSSLQSLSRDQVKTSEFASIDGKAVPTDLSKLDCVDSRSVAPEINSYLNLLGKNWCKDKTGYYLDKLCSNGVCDSFESVASNALCSELNEDNLDNINVDGVSEITGNEVLTDEIDVVGIVEEDSDFSNSEIEFPSWLFAHDGIEIDTSHIITNDVLCFNYDDGASEISGSFFRKLTGFITQESGCDITLGYSDDYLAKYWDVDINKKMEYFQEFVEEKMRPIKLKNVKIYLSSEEDLKHSEGGRAHYDSETNTVYYNDMASLGIEEELSYRIKNYPPLPESIKDLKNKGFTILSFRFSSDEEVLYHELIHAYTYQLEKAPQFEKTYNDKYSSNIYSNIRKVIYSSVEPSDYELQRRIFVANNIQGEASFSSRESMIDFMLDDPNLNYYEVVLKFMPELEGKMWREISRIDYIPEIKDFFETLDFCSKNLKYSPNMKFEIWNTVPIIERIWIPLNGVFASYQCINIHEFLAVQMQMIKYHPDIVYRSLQGEFGHAELYKKNLDLSLQHGWITQEDYDNVINYGNTGSLEGDDYCVGDNCISLAEIQNLYISSYQSAGAENLPLETYDTNMVNNFYNKAEEICEDCGPGEIQNIALELLDRIEQSTLSSVGTSSTKSNLKDLFRDVRKSIVLGVQGTIGALRNKYATAEKTTFLDLTGLPAIYIDLNLADAYFPQISDKMNYKALIAFPLGEVDYSKVNSIPELPSLSSGSFRTNSDLQKVVGNFYLDDNERLKVTFENIPKEKVLFQLAVEKSPDQNSISKDYQALESDPRSIVNALILTSDNELLFIKGSGQELFNIVNDVSKEGYVFRVDGGTNSLSYSSYPEIYNQPGWGDTTTKILGAGFSIYSNVYQTAGVAFYEQDVFDKNFASNEILDCDPSNPTLIARAGKVVAQATGIGDERDFCSITDGTCKDDFILETKEGEIDCWNPTGGLCFEGKCTSFAEVEYENEKVAEILSKFPSINGRVFELIDFDINILNNDRDKVVPAFIKILQEIGSPQLRRPLRGIVSSNENIENVEKISILLLENFIDSPLVIANLDLIVSHISTNKIGIERTVSLFLKNPLFDKIYNNPKISFLPDYERGSIAFAVFRLTDGKENYLDFVNQILDFILEKRKEFSEKIILGPEVNFIPIKGEEIEYYLIDIWDFAIERGVINTPHEDLKAEEDSIKIKEMIEQSSGPTTIWFNGHSSGYTVGRFSFDELSDSLIKRGNLEEVTIIIDSCYGYDYLKRLFENLKLKDSQSFPSAVSSANKGKPSMNSIGAGSLLLISLEKLELKKGDPLLGKHIYLAEEFSKDDRLFYSFFGLFSSRFPFSVKHPFLGGYPSQDSGIFFNGLEISMSNPYHDCSVCEGDNCPVDSGLASNEQSNQVTTSAILSITGNQVKSQFADVCRISNEIKEEKDYKEYSRSIVENMERAKMDSTLQNFEGVLKTIESNPKVYGTWDITKLRSGLYSHIMANADQMYDLDEIIRRISINGFNKQIIFFLANGQQDNWEIGNIWTINSNGDKIQTQYKYRYLPEFRTSKRLMNPQTKTLEKFGTLEILTDGKATISLLVTNKDFWDDLEDYQERPFWSYNVYTWNGRDYGLPTKETKDLPIGTSYSLLYGDDKPDGKIPDEDSRELIAILTTAKVRNLDVDRERLDSLPCGLILNRCNDPRTHGWAAVGGKMLGLNN